MQKQCLSLYVTSLDFLYIFLTKTCIKINPCPAEVSIFHRLTQFPASNDDNKKKIMKNRHLHY